MAAEDDRTSSSEGGDGKPDLMDVIAAVAAKCGVDEDVLIPMPWSACPHAESACSAPVGPPRALTQAHFDEVLKAYNAERLYQTEVLGKPAPPPPAPPARLDSAPETCADVQGVCKVCRVKLGADHVILLPGWDVYCRKHARREVMRWATSTAHLTITPRGDSSAVYCLACKRGVDWRGSCGEIGCYPVPEELDPKHMVAADPGLTLAPGGDDDDVDHDAPTAAAAKACLTLAALAAEARSWHSLCAPPASWRHHLAVTGVFFPTTGIDPAGLDSEFSLEFYKYMSTGFATLPNAAVYRAPAAEESRDDGTSSGVGSGGFGKRLPYVALNPAVGGNEAATDTDPARKYVFGLLLYPDEDALAEAETAAACGIAPDAGGSGVPLEDEDVLALKIRTLAARFPEYTLTPRQVWSGLDEQWVTAIVPHKPPVAGDELAPARDHYTPGDDVEADAGDSASEADDEDEADAFRDPMDTTVVTAPDTGRVTRAISSWVRFFMDAYLVARGIGYVGEVARVQEQRRS